MPKLKPNKDTPVLEHKQRVESILALIAYGKKQYTRKENKHLAPYHPLTLKRACLEIGMTPQNFFYYMREYPALKEKYEDMRVARREKIKNLAEDNIDKAISWKMDIEDLDLAKLSMQYMKDTDKAHNVKMEIDMNVKSLNLNISEEEIMAKIQELMAK